VYRSVSQRRCHSTAGIGYHAQKSTLPAGLLAIGDGFAILSPLVCSNTVEAAQAVDKPRNKVSVGWPGQSELGEWPQRDSSPAVVICGTAARLCDDRTQLLPGHQRDGRVDLDMPSFPDASRHLLAHVCTMVVLEYDLPRHHFEGAIVAVRKVLIVGVGDQ
jgi:hypothetical protein